MTRRQVPRIAPTDLRDHATEERMARVWARLEQDLTGAPAAPPRRSAVAAALLAAAFSAFGGGLLLGRALWRDQPLEPPPVVASQDVSAVPDVFAAGTRARTFALPGGGAISLEPGTTMEAERFSDVGDVGSGALTLRLVQGEAAVDTASSDRGASLAIIAGDARVSSAPGSVFRVRHGVDDLAVNVSDGSVRLTSPAGSRDLGRGQEDRVPIRQRTTSLVTPPPLHTAPTRSSAPPPREAEEPPSEQPPTVIAAPDWRARYNAGDETAALELLRQQGGGIDGAIGSARTAKELMDLSDLLRGKGGDQAAAIRALTRVVDAFPSDANAQIAAYTLGNMYARVGDQAQAAKYWERARSISPEGTLAEDSLCKRIGAEVGAGHKDEANRMAQEYVSKYPDGRCEAVQSILSGGGEPEEPPSEPEAPPPDGSAKPKP